MVVTTSCTFARVARVAGRAVVICGVSWGPVVQVLDNDKVPFGDFPEAALALFEATATDSGTNLMQHSQAVWDTTLDRQYELPGPAAGGWQIVSAEVRSGDQRDGSYRVMIPIRRTDDPVDSRRRQLRDDPLSI